MTDGHQRLPEALAKQVLARAAQLDESERMSVSATDLRTAAVEAGISSSAVDQALSEIANPPVVATGDVSGQRRRGARWRKYTVVALVIGLFLFYLVGRRTVIPSQEQPAPPPVQTPPPPGS